MFFVKTAEQTLISNHKKTMLYTGPAFLPGMMSVSGTGVLARLLSAKFITVSISYFVKFVIISYSPFSISKKDCILQSLFQCVPALYFICCAYNWNAISITSSEPYAKISAIGLARGRASQPDYKHS